MTLHTALLQGVKLLEQADVGSARLTAEVLLCHAVKVERSYLFAHPEQELREVEWIHYGRYLHERMGGKPTQYITRKQEFYGRGFRVSKDVLIPRPETEHLVEAVIPLARGRIVDVGSGSGAIAVTLALETRQPVVAVDLSQAALSLTIDNAKCLDADVRPVQADLLSAFADSSVDLVVSNPPYIAETTRESLQREVRDWEPSLALFGGKDGLDVYRRLVPEALRVLRAGGHLALELGYDSLPGVQRLLPGQAHVIADLAGIPRVIVFEKT